MGDEYVQGYTVVFYFAEPASGIRFVANGDFEYTRAGRTGSMTHDISMRPDINKQKQPPPKRRRGFKSGGSDKGVCKHLTQTHWISENALWTHWVHAGSLGTVGGGVLISLEA